jgi:hypothetical protein
MRYANQWYTLYWAWKQQPSFTDGSQHWHLLHWAIMVAYNVLLDACCKLHLLESLTSTQYTNRQAKQAYLVLQITWHNCPRRLACLPSLANNIQLDLSLFNAPSLAILGRVLSPLSWFDIPLQYSAPRYESHVIPAVCAVNTLHVAVFW